MTDGNLNLPEPLVSVDVDLKDFPYTPIYRARLFGSTFHAHVSDSGWRAGVTLWLKSWDQVPAGSLPADEVDLCRLAELGRDLKAWAKIKDEAMHGWFMCSDGRLYHNVVAQGVNEAWLRKCGQRNKTKAAREARLSHRLSQTTLPSVTSSVTENVTSTVTSSKRRELEGKGESPSVSPPSAPPSLIAEASKPQKSPVNLADWKPNEQHRQQAMLLGYDDAWLGEQAELYRDHRLEHGAVVADPDAGFRSWLRRARNFAAADAAAKPGDRNSAAEPKEPWELLVDAARRREQTRLRMIELAVARMNNDDCKRHWNYRFGEDPTDAELADARRRLAEQAERGLVA